MKTLKDKKISFQEFTDFMMSGKNSELFVIENISISNCTIYDVPEGRSIFVSKWIKYFLFKKFVYFFDGYLLIGVVLKDNVFYDR